MSKYKIIKRDDLKIIQEKNLSVEEKITRDRLAEIGKTLPIQHCEICLDTLEDIDLYEIEKRYICTDCFVIQNHMYSQQI